MSVHPVQRGVQLGGVGHVHVVDGQIVHGQAVFALDARQVAELRAQVQNRAQTLLLEERQMLGFAGHGSHGHVRRGPEDLEAVVQTAGGCGSGHSGAGHEREHEHARGARQVGCGVVSDDNYHCTASRHHRKGFLSKHVLPSYVAELAF